jgi:hypothetical protein
VRRRFRDDQLRAPLRLHVRAAEPARLAAAFNDGAPRMLDLAAGERELAIVPEGVRRGLNTLAFESTPGVELVDIGP